MVLNRPQGWDPDKEKLVKAALDDPEGFYRAVNPQHLPPKVEELMDVIDHVNEDTRTAADTAKGSGMGALSRGMGVFDDPLTLRRDNPKLPPWEKAKRDFDLGAKRAEINSQIHKTEARIADAVAAKTALTELADWCESSPSKLERPDGSVLHKLTDAIPSRILNYGPNDEIPYHVHEIKDALSETQVLVVEHDWASAFAGSKDFDEGEFRLPYPECVFEFKVSGQRIIVLAAENDKSPWGMSSRVAVQSGDYWWLGDNTHLLHDEGAQIETDALRPLYLLLRRNVRALCIALDAEVAITEAIRAPHRLNQARERQGKTPLSDYHTVSLARRSRVAPLPSDGHEPSHRKRLHFRRGHWRHFEAHKTWVRWCLVGDPDLGFVDKHYRA